MNATGRPRLKRVGIVAQGDTCESLVLSLQAIFRVYGRSIDYDELMAVTGVAFMAARPQGPDDALPPWACGRHAFLEPAARLYGLDLRSLHPPSAAPIPPAPPEFEQHFRDSYLPFIREALSRDEPVLAWMGWPPPELADWGVVTGVDPDSGRCAGQTALSRGRCVQMAGAPVQVYLVQACAAVVPSSEQVVETALDRAAAVLSNRIDPSFGTPAGVEALLQWREMLTREQGGTGADSTTAEACRQSARIIVAARRSAVRFFQKHRDQVSPARAGVIDDCVRYFNELVSCLSPLCESGVIADRLGTDAGRRESVDVISRAIDIERRTAALVRLA